MNSTLEFLHKKRLTKKDIIIEENFKGNNKDKPLVRRTDGTRNDEIINNPRLSKKYFFITNV